MSSKISQLTAATAFNLDDEFEIRRGSSNLRGSGFLLRPGFLYDDFLGGFPPWFEADIQNGASTAIEGSPEWWGGAFGIRKLETGTGGSGKVGIRAPQSMGAGTGRLTTYCRMLVEDMPSSGNDYVFAVGGVPNGLGAWAQMAAALWFSNANANWQLIVANNGSPVDSLDTGVAVVGGVWLELITWINMTTNTSGAFINGVATSGLSGFTHWTPNNRISSNVYLQQIAGTTNRKIALDKVGYLYEGL